MGQRQDYAIGDAVTDRSEAEAICTAVLEVLRPMIHVAHVDVYSDYDDQMPEAVRRAEAQLAALGEVSKRRGSDPRMDVVVSVGDPEWQAVETYASWSINVDLNGADGEDVATFHDCGYSVVAALTDEEVSTLKQRLRVRAPVALLTEIHERRRLEKREARRTRLHAWMKRWGARR